MKPMNYLKLLTPLALIALMISAVGCSNDSTTSPGGDQTQNDKAPTLPDAELLDFDFSFFDQGKALEKSADFTKQNFINAYLRVVGLTVLTELVLAPPVTAFAVALHNVPSLQPDGSWIWDCSPRRNRPPTGVRLRGLPISDGVEWELRVTLPVSHETPLDNEIWFTGVTRLEGTEGHWTFYDPTLPGDPLVAELDWGDGVMGRYLMLTCREGDDDGDTLAFYDDDPVNSIIYTDHSEGQEWYIRWNEVDNSGSLMVPEYNDGEVACWDENLDDVECE